MANTPNAVYPIPNERGAIGMIELANPAANSNWTFSTPDIREEWRYKITSVMMRLVTDATVANRWIGIRFFITPGTDLWRQFYTTSQPASATYDYGFAATFKNPYEANGWRYTQLPDIQLDTRTRMQSTLNFSAAGDQISLIRIHWTFQIDQLE